MQTTSLTQSQRQAYEGIVARCESVLARWSPSNPMRPSIERQLADARRQLAA